MRCELPGLASCQGSVPFDFTNGATSPSSCVNLNSSTEHCGSCGNSCGGGVQALCIDGKCAIENCTELSSFSSGRCGSEEEFCLEITQNCTKCLPNKLNCIHVSEGFTSNDCETDASEVGTCGSCSNNCDEFGTGHSCNLQTTGQFACACGQSAGQCQWPTLHCVNGQCAECDPTIFNEECRKSSLFEKVYCGFDVCLLRYYDDFNTLIKSFYFL